ncbi:hypothetical protein ON058_09445 [Demequina sp. B12]|uniref:hypothetical protein n=1 Tax=Demequina sp. B12 TaxID=2992757 RepID=UPI00237BFEFA|nr:hypothetical protein [Demequina sp. B12]MDE0573636.1 hypothetical protein [Demequina sp. B12]
MTVKKNDGGYYFEFKDHGDHDKDIVPPFEVKHGTTYESTTTAYPGKNWDDYGQWIFANGCELPEDICELINDNVDVDQSATTFRHGGDDDDDNDDYDRSKCKVEVDLCHWDNRKDKFSSTSDWVTVKKNDGGYYFEFKDHGDHDKDIVPPFEVKHGTTYESTTTAYPGKNWDDYGQWIFANGCELPEDICELINDNVDVDQSATTFRHGGGDDDDNDDYDRSKCKVEVDLCHKDKNSNEYTLTSDWVTVKKNDGGYYFEFKDHNGYWHKDDIVPPFEVKHGTTYESTTTAYPGKNWDGNEEFFANGCEYDLEICKKVWDKGGWTWAPMGVREADYNPEIHKLWDEELGAAACEYTEVVCWEMPSGMDFTKANWHLGTPGLNKMPDINANAFPQQRVDCEYEPPCGVWVQKDWYKINTDAKEEVYENLGDTLEWDGGPEDSAIVVNWKFYYSGDCEASGEVPVCLPSDQTASGFTPGVIEWTYLKNYKGEESHTVTPDPIPAGTIHPAFDVLDHLNATYKSYSASNWGGWNDYKFNKYLKNGCQNNVDICVEKGSNGEGPQTAFSSGPGSQGGWWFKKSVTEQEYADFYSDAPLPVNGKCKVTKDDIKICHAKDNGKLYPTTVAWMTVGNKSWFTQGGSDLNFYHGDHDEDIIPPFNFGSGDYEFTYAGMNWDDWSYGEFKDFLRNGCEYPDEYCPTELDGNASDWEPLALYPWEKKRFVKYTDWTGDPNDCFKPGGQVEVCVPNNEEEDGWSLETLYWKANWNSEDWKFWQTVFGFPWAPFNAADELVAGWSVESWNYIVPPIDEEWYGVPVAHPGVNWTPLNAAIWGTGCDPVEQEIEVTSTPVTCEDPDGGTISAAYRAATGAGDVKLRLYKLVQNGEGFDKVYLDASGLPAAEGVIPVLLEVLEGGGLHDLDLSGLGHGTYGFETVDEIHRAIYNKEFTIERPDVECAEIDPDVLSGVCVDGVPYLNYTISVKDDFDEVDFNDGARFTFIDDADPALMHELEPVALALASQDGIEYSYDSDTKTHTWKGQMLWPGASESPQNWPGYVLEESGEYTNVGNDNFGWTRDGMKVTLDINPSVEFDVAAYPSEDPACDGPESDLGASFISTECVADAPWIDYSIVLTDPAGSYEGDGTVKVTLIGTNGETYEVPEPIMLGEDGTVSGRVLWPGASVEPAEGYTEVDPYDANSFVPTGWPGWALEDGEWVTVGTDNFGWTRLGMTIKVEVNPELEIEANYPPATPECNANPVQTVSAVASAATPVGATVITYTG